MEEREQPGIQAGLAEINGVKPVIDWIQDNYGALIAAGLGIATVGLVTLLLRRRGGLRSFYEEESSDPSKTVVH